MSAKSGSMFFECFDCKRVTPFTEKPRNCSWGLHPKRLTRRCRRPPQPTLMGLFILGKLLHRQLQTRLARACWPS